VKINLRRLWACIGGRTAVTPAPVTLPPARLHPAALLKLAKRRRLDTRGAFGGQARRYSATRLTQPEGGIP
jgi:hypothetical protein